MAVTSECRSPWGLRALPALPSLLPVLLCSAGCSQSPSQDILGSFFPAWILCGAVGVAGAILCRVALGAVRLHDHVLAPPLAYLAVATAVTLFAWLTWFGQ